MRTLCKAALYTSCITLLCAAGRARAQETPAAAVAPSSQNVAPPSLKQHGTATYPPAALRDRLEGTVGLELTIDDTGAVADARVTSPAGHGFDEAAVEAAKKFVFLPATDNGTPTRSTVQFAYEFHLPTPAPAALAAPAGAAAASPTTQTPLAAPSAMSPATPGDVQPGGSTLVLAQRPLDPPPEVTAASDSSTSQKELSLRPRYRPEALLEVVPGVFSVQHAGGGKAQQDFVRGFNLDHGTDMAVFIEDSPLNLVSHAHGQGWTDYHSIIPETVARVDSAKGTYAADVGDFGTAGSIHFRMADHVDESIAKLELAPTTGHERLVVVESPDFGEKWRMVVAAEVFHENGPFIHPEDFGRLNGYAKVTRQVDERSELSFLTTVYSGSWSMSGVLPARAVCGESDGTPTPAAYSGSHCLNRFDSVDPTQGGASQRFMAMVPVQEPLRHELGLSGFPLRAALESAALPERRHRGVLPTRWDQVRVPGRARRHPDANGPRPEGDQPRRPRRHEDSHDVRSSDPERRPRGAASPNLGARPPGRRRCQHSGPHL